MSNTDCFMIDFRGLDCSVRKGLPPEILEITTEPCITTYKCPESVSMSVSNVDIHDHVYCHVRYREVGIIIIS